LTPAASNFAKLRRRWIVWNEPEPAQIIENRALELRSASLAIVVLDSEEDTATGGPRHSPDVDGVHNVTEVKKAGGRWGEAGNDHGLRALGSSISGLGDFCVFCG
jgi:hypothetical protein